ncbi:BMC domain-containing protein [Streptococcus gallinaceus]|uniref:Ethanolamine utilization protein EutS n=1 Tax=Streptococcus gallinaceus TaxID=165758 RepID=A0ABV2JKU2_9STRE|nr:BMC domain-containing protein [Streptococcus gallinaceus]MCP1639167.1 ethanolamine utilization protein EutS [Streptococcus gallinaceus]MCP1770190.1 ethanolamine utilization protein EutS [Streptococcus gallinaceus]
MIEGIGKIDRIIQESVPGKQITLAHMIAAPIQSVYQSLGVDESGAIGILALTPYETAIIAADIAGKAASVDICFVDRFTGSVMFSGDVQSVQTALQSILTYFEAQLDFTVVNVTQS